METTKKIGAFLLSLLTLAALKSQPVYAQGGCGDGTCTPGEGTLACPQDCGILLLDEDWEDSQVQGWHYDPAQWEITEDDGSAVWRNTTQGWASAGSLAWSDYVWFLRVRRVNGNANLYWRTEWPNNYDLLLESGRVALWTERTGWPQELTSALVDLGTIWHNYQIDAVARQITVTVDSTVILTYTDGLSAALRGGIGLEAFDSDGAHFDDLQLYSLVPNAITVCATAKRPGSTAAASTRCRIAAPTAPGISIWARPASTVAGDAP